MSEWDPQGSTHLKKGYRMCGPQDPFSRLSCIHKTPSWGTSSFTRPSFERKMWHFSSKANIFKKIWHFSAPETQFDCNFRQKSLQILQNVCSKAPVFDENPLTSPHFHGNLSAHKPPSLEIWATQTYQKKKLSAPQSETSDLLGLDVPHCFKLDALKISLVRYTTVELHLSGKWQVETLIALIYYNDDRWLSSLHHE